MSRKDLIKHHFPEEYKAELLEILEDVGHIEDTKLLADYFGVSGYALSAFLQTKEAKTAAALATPATRNAWLENFALARAEAQDQAFPEESLIEQGMIPQDAFTGEPVIYRKTRKTKIKGAE